MKNKTIGSQLSREQMKRISGGASALSTGTLWKCAGGIEICSVSNPAGNPDCGVSGCNNLRALCLIGPCGG